MNKIPFEMSDRKKDREMDYNILKKISLKIIK